MIQRLIAATATAIAAACTQPASDDAHVSPPAQIESQQAVDSDRLTRRIFVSNYLGDTISVIEGDPGTEVRSIPLGDSPHGLAIRPTSPPLLAVARSTGSAVTFIDPETLQKKADVETSGGPQDLAFSPDGNSLYVVSPSTHELHTIDVRTMKTRGEALGFDKKPRRILIDPSNGRVFVLLVDHRSRSGIGAEVAVLEPGSLRIAKRIPVGRHPDAMALGNNGRTLATTSFDDSTITVVDTRSLETVGTYPARTGMGLAIHPEKPIAYSCESFDDIVQVLHLETGEEIATISAGAWPTYPAFGAGGRFLYVPHEESDSIVMLDTNTNKVAAKIAVGREPIEVAIYDPIRSS